MKARAPQRAPRSLGIAVLVGATVLVGGGALAGAATADSDPDQVRAVAQEILDREQYQEPRGNIIGDALRWIAEHLFPDSVRPGGVGGVGTGIVGDLMVIVVAVGVATLLYRVVRGWRPGSRAKPEVPEAKLAIDIEERRSAQEWASLAARLEAEGQYAEAVRARYGELVSTLIEDGSVAAAAGRTTGELRVDVAVTRPAGERAFDDASELFDVVWYGGAPADSGDVARLRTLGAAVLSAPRVVDEPEPEPEREPAGIAP
ncbi:MAG: DUF4129 domain-containing protein [Acidimicrobiales bacterium]